MISLCRGCWCMTHTIDNACGKCKADKRPILLELFSGHGDVSRAFVAGGGMAYRVDWSDRVEAELHADVSKLTADDVIALCGRVPDFIWASPQCTTYSIATHRHRTIADGLQPKTDLAKHDDEVNTKLWQLIDDLVARGTKHYFVENPRGRMRHMDFVKGRPRYTITYCSYGNRGTARGYEDTYIMKPTDIWTSYPDPEFRQQCKQVNPPHVHGSWELAHKRDYLSRGTMPEELTKDLAQMMIGVEL